MVAYPSKLLELRSLVESAPDLIDVSQVPQHPTPTISKLDKSLAVDYMSTTALAVVNAFSSRVDVTLDGCKLWASIVYDDWPDLKAGEILLIFKKAIKQKQYAAIDVNTMLSWVTDYYKSRSEAVSTYLEHKHQRLKNENDNWNGIPAPDWFKERTKELDINLKMSNIGTNAGLRKFVMRKEKTEAEKKKDFEDRRAFLKEQAQKLHDQNV